MTFPNLVPVGLKEAALDSPSFRAASLHLSEQADLLERWLDGLIKASTKLSQEATILDNLVNGLTASLLPLPNLSEALIDHGCSLFATRRFSEAIRDLWTTNVVELRKVETQITEPIQAFQQNELRNFKEDRKQLEQSQKILDQLQMRYSAQSKTKEPSSLREDAFQLHEARKVYLKASMDFASSAPRLRSAVDRVLIRAFHDQSHAMHREGSNILLAKLQLDMHRIRSWSKEIELNERACRKEYSDARKQIEDAAEQAARPSRELEDYAQSVTASLNNRGPSTSTVLKPRMTGGKQGWLNAKSLAGKPARPVWVRRWFYVKNGVFGWLVLGSRSGGVEESERIGVLLCGLRFAAAEERRFCFEVKTKDNTLVLQADSQVELAEWMAAFDGVKQRALEDPTNQQTSLPGMQAKQMLGLAFSISPPSALEFAANSTDASLSGEDSQDRSVSLSLAPPNDASALIHRGSFDVSPGRRSTAFEGDSSRDQSGKIRQKFDIRKPPNGSSGGQAGNASSGGIASLISASHMTLPLAPSAVAQPLESNARSSSFGVRTNLSVVLKALPSTTLAPSTLANPPNPTNLSFAAVIVCSEKGVGIGRISSTGSTPSGPLANTWGSFDWVLPNSSDGESELSNAAESDQVLDTDKQPTGINLEKSVEHSTMKSQPAHRKTVSLDGDAADLERAKTNSSDFPSHYPRLLKHQDAQFRLLFPHSGEEEKLLLVFQAVWGFDNQQQITGRVFVTISNFHFYSNQSGMIHASSIRIDNISDITGAPGRDFDILFLHLRASKAVEQSRVTIKIFLDSFKLLQRRLDFLLSNAKSESSQDLTACVQKLVELELSNEDEVYNPAGGALENTKNTSFQKGFQSVPQAARGSRHPIFNLGNSRASYKDTEIDSPASKVPSKAIEYNALGRAAVSERHFEISAKALFYILCGDRSVVSQLLYHERGAKNIRQGPWERSEQDQFRRSFDYTIEETPAPGRTRRSRLVDTQTIDVVSDQLFVLTYQKSPWNMPFSRSFVLTSRIVISQTAKSRCKLAIFTSVDWTQRIPLFALVVEHKALTDLEQDARDLTDVTSQQAFRLGTHGSTKKAIRIFGMLGQATQIIEFADSDRSALPVRPYRGGKRTVFGLLADYVASLAIALFSVITRCVRQAAKNLYMALDTHFLISLLLFLSVAVNMLLSSTELITFWHEQQALQFMRNLGIGHGLMIDKSLSLNVFESAIYSDENTPLDANNPCYSAFTSGVSPGSLTHVSSSSTPSLRRLRQTRQNMGSYRHDLLVALKVVNSIDREIRQAEWEYWITEETESCKQADQLLLIKNRSSSEPGASGSGNLEGARKLKEYCSSCTAVKHKLAI